MQVLDVITVRRPGPILTVALVALATAALLAQPSQSLPNRAGLGQVRRHRRQRHRRRAAVRSRQTDGERHAKFPFDLVIMLGDNMTAANSLRISSRNSSTVPRAPLGGRDIPGVARQPRSTTERVLQVVQHERPALLHVRGDGTCGSWPWTAP